MVKQLYNRYSVTELLTFKYYQKSMTPFDRGLLLTNPMYRQKILSQQMPDLFFRKLLSTCLVNPEFVKKRITVIYGNPKTRI
jgi:hypothetical protein